MWILSDPGHCILNPYGVLYLEFVNSPALPWAMDMKALRGFENMICIAVAFRGLCPRLKYVTSTKLGRCRSANSPALPWAMDMKALRGFENMICIAVAFLGSVAARMAQAIAARRGRIGRRPIAAQGGSRRIGRRPIAAQGDFPLANIYFSAKRMRRNNTSASRQASAIHRK